MNVLKIVIVSLFFVRLFGLDFYIPQNFNLSNIKNKKSFSVLDFKRYKNAKNIDFNNSLALISYNNIPLIFEKNLEIITPIGEVKEYILTRRKALCKIRKIIDLDFASKILLDKCDANYTSVKGNFDDFLAGKADAIVYNKNVDIANIFDFPLKLYGIDFNKYFIVGNREFINENRELIEELNKKFEIGFDFRKNLIYETLMISSLYLKRKIRFNKILFENYQVLKEKNEEALRVMVTGKWAPFQMYKNGKLYGIGIDFWKLVAKKAHLKYKFILNPDWNKALKAMKNKKIDVIVSTSATPDRKKYAIFSKSYVSFPLGIICRTDEHFNSINDISSIAVGKNYTAEKLMKKHYPNLHYVETKNVLEALNLVKDKKAQCAVDILPVILWNINKNHLMNMQLAFKTPFKFNVQIMLRNDYQDILLKINKAIDKISPQEKERIVNTYLKSIIIEQHNYMNKFALLMMGVIVLIIGIIFFFGEKKLEMVKQEAMYDELTGILNRRGIDYRIKDMDKGSILFFDIDHFKQVNDTYGHEFGDYVLKEIGKILKDTFRKSDIVGRWGGEEFIVILPNTNYFDAIRVAEKLRKTIENHDFKGKKITVSIGITEYEGDLEENLKKADEALYEAKNSGRNQVKGKK